MCTWNSCHEDFLLYSQKLSWFWHLTLDWPLYFQVLVKHFKGANLPNPFHPLAAALPLLSYQTLNHFKLGSLKHYKCLFEDPQRLIYLTCMRLECKVFPATSSTQRLGALCWVHSYHWLSIQDLPESRDIKYCGKLKIKHLAFWKLFRLPSLLSEIRQHILWNKVWIDEKIFGE